jgi:pimeloyl-ACP methyl ester carboxylesterase
MHYNRGLIERAPIPSVSLILLPGLDGTGILFQPLINALPASVKPIVVKYPPDRHLTYEELLPLVLDAIPGRGPFILLGESFSGPLAVMAAAGHPKNLIGLILCASFVTGPIPFIGPAIRVVARSLLFRFFPLLQRLKGLLEGYSTAELRALSTAALALVRPHVMAARVRMVFRTDATDALHRCEVPILYIAGARDYIVPGRNLRLIQTIKPDIQSVALAAPHMVLQTRPREGAVAISAFASSVDVE